MDIIAMDKDKGKIPAGMEGIVKDVITAKEVPDYVHDLDYLFFAMPGVDIPPILNSNLLKKLKKGVIVVNVGRGNVIDE